MIEKITRLQNIGKFIEFSGIAGTEFGKLTLIYGENGQGKTTLAAVMRSLKTGEGRYIQERRSLGHIGTSEVNINLGSISVAFRNYHWSAACPQLEIFDTAFIHDNLFSGDSIKTEQKRNLYHFVMGEESVYFARSIAKVDDAGRAVNLKIKVLKGKISSYIRGMNFDEFLSLEPDPDIDRKISEASAQLEAVNEADAFSRRPLLSEVKLPKLWFQRVEDLLASELENISGDAERMVKEHIAHMDQLGESWIGQGMQYLKEENCPFCGQKIDAGSIVSSYRDYFGQAYAQHKLRIAKAAEWIETSLSERNLLTMQRKIQENEHLQDFWQKYLSMPCFSIDFEEIRRMWSELHESLSEVLQKKAASPLEKMTLDERLRCAIIDCDAISKQFEEYNRQVREINRKIAEKKEQVRSAVPALAQRKLETLQNARTRRLPELVKLCDEYRQQQQEKAELDQEKAELKQSLNEYACREIPKYQQTINNFLKESGADFQLIKSKESHIGGKPGLAYCLLINNIAIGMKPSKTEPSFKNALSSGDRSMLAFAFFVVKLCQAADISDRIIILDDPVSDLDLKRSKFVENNILKLCERAKQVILLSHNPYFLKSVAKGHAKANTRALRIVSSAQGNTLSPWNSESV